MRNVTLGSTGITVPQNGFGALPIQRVDTDTAAAILRRAYECGMRFLADHLDGDVYFKIHRPGHNLDRARTQLRLIAEMEERLDEMNAVVQSYCK